ncbi:ribosome biogenesis GTPase YqeH [Shimazuella sp. AN120528]|uniref:ribosome biogenesis GTPase YqeH n=1 Tax=Shimazuella soli TaxID=1892854 RepID=UPI001F0F623B|nr:ribosome biogenesis GTPase YqeH [Shimazuella soli]
MKFCEGCGIQLQTEEEKKPGYVPPAALEREHQYCKRCYRIRHYNELAVVEHDPDIYLQILGQIADTNSLVVQIVDLFDIAGSWIPGIHRHIGNNPLLLFGNKMDLFPQSVKAGKLKEWIYLYSKEMGIKPVDVVVGSASKQDKMQEVRNAIERYRQGRDVYIVGVTNVGKSTFLNYLLEEPIITTSPYPGTTLDVIHIPLDDGRNIVDTPGIVKKNRISEWVSPKELSKVIPKSRLNPKVYQLNSDQTIFIAGLARFDYVEGQRQPFTCYFSNQLYLHRTKQEQATAFYEKHLGEMLQPPHDPSDLPALQKHRIVLTGGSKQDIVISGLGWIACGKERGVVDVYAPKGIEVTLRPSII